MTRTRHDTSPQAQAIRAAGFVRVPGGLSLTKEDRDLEMFLAEKHLREINRIKEQVKELEDRRWQE